MDTVAVSFPALNLNFNITREAFVIGDFAIYWYAVIIAVGAVLAVIYGMTQAKKYGVNPDKLIDLAIVALFFGIIGARLYYVLFNLENYSSFGEIINLRDGGLGIYGGLILGVVAAYVASRINKTRFLPCLDLAAGGFFIGQAIGRWGNFVNQEAFGTNTTSIFGMYSEKTQEYLSQNAWELFKAGIEVDPSAPVHPCFLYESFWCAVGFAVIILFYRHHRKFDGELMLFYAAWYGTGRAIIEGLRTDSLMIGPFRVSQLLSLILAVCAVAAIVLIRLSIAKKRAENPKFLQLYVETEESKRQFAEDPLVIANKAEALLLECEATLDSAEETIQNVFEMPKASDNLEQLANEFGTTEETIELVEKQIDLVYAKLTLVSSMIEEYIATESNEPVSDEDSEIITEFEDDAESLDSNEVRIDGAKEAIESARDYIDELFEGIDAIREQYETQDEYYEENEIDREEHEILDTVSDEDEIDISSPNESK